MTKQLVDQYKRAIQLFMDQDFLSAEKLLLEIVNTHQMTEIYHHARYYLAYIKCHMNKYDEALHIYRDLLESSYAYDAYNRPILYHQIAMIYRMKGELDLALKYLRKEKDLLKTLDDSDLFYSANYYEMGEVFLAKKMFSRAAENFEFSLSYARLSRDLIALACALRGAGDLLMTLGELTRAKLKYQESYHCFRQANDPGSEDIGKKLKALESLERLSR